jgi:hypothetical protein
MSYTLTVTVRLEGVTAPLQIHAETVNELRKQVQQLQEHDLIATHLAETQAQKHMCQYHGPMKDSTKRPGTYFCPLKMGNGSYCKSKA